MQFIFVSIVDGKRKESPSYCVPHLTTKPFGVEIKVPKHKPKAPSKQDRVLSKNQEQEVMKKIGGRRQPASGAFRDKGDGRLCNHLRMEAKFTRAKQFTLKQSTISKLRTECSDTEYPLIVLDFKNREGRTYDRLAILPFTQWEKMHAATYDDSGPH